MNIDLTNNTVAQYKMNDNEADKVVINEFGDDGTNLANTDTKTTTGITNGALQFDGGVGGDYVDTNSSFQSTFRNSFTINFWHRWADGNPAVATVDFFGQDPADTNYVALMYSTGNFNFAYKSNNNASDPSPLNPYSDGQETWHMITFTVNDDDGSNVTTTAYNDGVQIATDTSPVVMSVFTQTDTFWIGASNNAGNNNYEGDIDNFCIFDKTLSEKEILFLYSGGAGTETLEGIVFDNNPNGIVNTFRNISHQVPLGDNLVKFYQEFQEDRAIAISFAHDSIIQQNRDISNVFATIGGIHLSVSVGYDDNIHSSDSDAAGGFYALDVIISSEPEDNVDYNTVPADPQINGIQFGMAKKEGLYFLRTYQIAGDPEPNSIATFGGVPMALGKQNELIVRDSGYTTADVNRYLELMFFGVPIQVGMVDAENKYFLIISPI
jgi:hypothetical protein